MRVNIAVVGAGYWGKNLVRVFREMGFLHAVCDIDEERARSLVEDDNTIRIYTQYRDVLSDTDVNAIVISTPAVTHYEFAKKALMQDKDVLVEKPLSLMYTEGQSLIDIANKRKRILMVGHILQYHPAINRLSELIEDGTLGKVQYIYSNRLSFGKIRREENILWSFAPHDISVVIRLMGRMPDKVSAKGSTYLQHDIADVTVSQLHFPDGTNAHIFVSWLHPFKEQKLVVVGSKNMAVFDDTAPWASKLTLYGHEIVWKCGVPEGKKAAARMIALNEVEPLKVECEAFVRAIETREVPITDGYEGLNVLRVLRAFQASLDRNGEEMPLDKQENHYYSHPTAEISKRAIIGRGSKIWHYSHVMANASIGERCILGQNVFIAGDAVIGDNVKIQNNVSVFKGVHIEDDVFLGPSMVFTNVMNPRSFIERKSEFKNTLIKRGATIGANATIVCGNEIGEYAFIGSGAVVTRSVPAYALVYGNPAEVKGWVCRCGEKLTIDNSKESQRVQCSKCNDVYRYSENIIHIIDAGDGI